MRKKLSYHLQLSGFQMEYLLDYMCIYICVQFFT